jgi:hypothetical protein
VRSNAWTCDFSSTDSTIALSGGRRYNPTTSRSLASTVHDRHWCADLLRPQEPVATRLE